MSNDRWTAEMEHEYRLRLATELCQSATIMKPKDAQLYRELANLLLALDRIPREG
jgi:hypothetical protein